MIDREATATANPRRGIALMLLGILMFSLNDVLGKWLVSTYSVGQLLLFRSAAALVVLSPFVWRSGLKGIWQPERPGLQAARVVFSTGELLLFYWSVVFLPLVDAMTYYLAAPIYVAALSPLLLGERVGWRRWVAIAIGFGGVVIALQPSAATLSPAALIPIAGSLAFALMLITGRQLKGVPDLGLVFWQTAGAFAAGLVTAPFGWVNPGGRDLALLALLGIVSVGAHACVIRSLKLADAATVSPFQYTLLLWAILFGYLVFGDVPKPAMLAGAAIIIGAGLFIFYREIRARSAEAAGPVLARRGGQRVAS
jgi:drug/metabolite transporter (DMT)-like permease